MTFEWAITKTGYWHAYAMFDGHETKKSVCVHGVKKPQETLPGPATLGMEGICVMCKRGVLQMKKRYVAKS